MSITVDSQTLHICYATDDNFVDMTCQSMYSIILRKRPSTKIMFYILGDRLTDPKAFEIFKDVPNIGVMVAIIDGAKFMEGQDIPKAPAYATYMRFLIPVLPMFQNVSRVLWLDGDVFARRDLTNMFNAELNGHLIGMVKDASGILVQGVVTWPEPDYFHKDYYCNCGVILMDLDKLRLSKCADQWLTAVHHVGETKENDQHIMNRLMHYDTCLLPPVFNFSYHNLIRLPQTLVRYIERWNHYYNTHYWSLDELIQTSYVWHFHEEIEDHKRLFPKLKEILDHFESEWREFQTTRVVKPWNPADDQHMVIDCQEWFKPYMN